MQIIRFNTKSKEKGFDFKNIINFNWSRYTRSQYFCYNCHHTKFFYNIFLYMNLLKNFLNYHFRRFNNN